MRLSNICIPKSRNSYDLPAKAGYPAHGRSYAEISMGPEVLIPRPPSPGQRRQHDAFRGKRRHLLIHNP
jgi:hypothetical protein